jgi:hypothetical protein
VPVTTVASPRLPSAPQLVEETIAHLGVGSTGRDLLAVDLAHEFDLTVAAAAEKLTGSATPHDGVSVPV